MSKLRSTLSSTHRALVFCGAVALAQLPLADEPSVGAAGLAMTEATLDFCAQIDPKSADQYWQQGKALLQGMSEKKMAELRKSDEYRQAYDSAADLIRKVPAAGVMQACSSSLATSK